MDGYKCMPAKYDRCVYLIFPKRMSVGVVDSASVDSGSADEVQNSADS
jgi:hypothetical protein